MSKDTKELVKWLEYAHYSLTAYRPAGRCETELNAIREAITLLSTIETERDKCPICGMNEGCSHTLPERMRAIATERETLRDIAKQRLPDEVPHDEQCDADWIGAYQACIETARNALKSQPAQPQCEHDWWPALDGEYCAKPECDAVRPASKPAPPTPAENLVEEFMATIQEGMENELPVGLIMALKIVQQYIDRRLSNGGQK